MKNNVYNDKVCFEWKLNSTTQWSFIFVYYNYYYWMVKKFSSIRNLKNIIIWWAAYHIFTMKYQKECFYLKQHEPIIQQEYAKLFKLVFCLADCQIMYCLKGAVSARSRTPCKSTRSVVINGNFLRMHVFAKSYYNRTCKLF